MPYIKQENRGEILKSTPIAGSVVVLNNIVTTGELNFAVTELVKAYIGNNTKMSDSIRYSLINDVVGALEGAKLEFYRRIATVYEDQKIKENGDVY